MSCSALKRKYRDQIRGVAPDVRFLLLEGSPEVIGRRQAARPGHFMPPSLLASQFAILEPLAPDEDGIVLDVDQSVDAIVQGYVDQMSRETEES
jgi:gluconokinase